MRSIAFLSPDFLANPWPRYAHFREEQPVWWSDEIRMFCVFRHRDIRACLTSPDYTVEYPFRVSRQVFGETLLDLDGPRHQRLRRPSPDSCSAGATTSPSAPPPRSGPARRWPRCAPAPSWTWSAARRAPYR